MLLRQARARGAKRTAREGWRVAVEAEGTGRECPRERKAQESQGRRTWRNPAAVRPNRQRDETPEARPLRQQCL